MDRDQQRFLKNILNSVIRSAITRSLWGLPVWVAILIGLVATGAMWTWKLF